MYCPGRYLVNIHQKSWTTIIFRWLGLGLFRTRYSHWTRTRMQTRTRTFLLTEYLTESNYLKINLKHTNGGLGSETMSKRWFDNICCNLFHKIIGRLDWNLRLGRIPAPSDGWATIHYHEGRASVHPCICKKIKWSQINYASIISGLKNNGQSKNWIIHHRQQ